MGACEDREPEPGLVRHRGADGSGGRGGARGVRAPVRARRGARGDGDRLPARPDPGRVAPLRAAQARREPSHRRGQHVPQAGGPGGWRGDHDPPRAVDGGGEGRPDRAAPRLPGPARGCGSGHARPAPPGGHPRRERIRGADGRGEVLLARADHRRPLRGGRAVPPKHVMGPSSDVGRPYRRNP